MRLPSTAKRFAILLVLPLLLVGVAVIYAMVMDLLEGQDRDFWQSLEWASETLTTTGYGHDDKWEHPISVLFVIFVQFTGVTLTYLVFPLFLIPYFERRFDRRLPRVLPDLDDYVLIYRYSAAVSTLMKDMARAGLPAVIIEEDEAVARRLFDRGHQVVLVESDVEELDLGGLAKAKAMVANGKDHDSAAIILAARQAGFEGPIYALVDDPLHRKPIVISGASAAYTPKHALAAALAAKASDKISPRVSGVALLGEHLSVFELRVSTESDLAGGTLADAEIHARTGATVVGLWRDGEFKAGPSGSTVLQAGAILVAVGSDESLERLGELANPLKRDGHFVVLGYDELGSKVVQMLRDVGEQVLVVARDEGEGVDVVGDALDVETLNKARLGEARGVVVALGSDATNLFATTIIRDLDVDVPIVARVNRADNVKRVHAAGADFGLSVSQVTAQLLGQQMFGEEFVSLEPRARLAKAPGSALVGLSPPEVHRKTKCLLIGIERNDRVKVELGNDERIEENDIVYLCGSQDAISAYFAANPEARSRGR